MFKVRVSPQEINVCVKKVTIIECLYVCVCIPRLLSLVVARASGHYIHSGSQGR